MAAAEIGLQDWATRLPPRSLSASLYALPPQERLAGAIAAERSGCWIHADVILDPAADGGSAWGGVSAVEIRAVRDALPDARLDLHLMVLGSVPAQLWQAAVEQVVDELAGTRIERLTATAEVVEHLLASRPGALADFGELWCQLRDGAIVSGAHPWSSGSLVMLIDPGSTQRARTSRLEAVPAALRNGPVGLDGGVTSRIAGDAQAMGVSYLVVGRALFASRLPVPPDRQTLERV